MSGKSFKVVLLGEGRVGKSSIILRFMQGKFDERQQSTLSASCFDKSINLGGAESARISLWDTAGQERFHALGPLYYRDAGACWALEHVARLQGNGGGGGARRSALPFHPFFYPPRSGPSRWAPHLPIRHVPQSSPTFSFRAPRRWRLASV